MDKDRIYFLIIVLRACSCLFEVRSRNYGGAIILHPPSPTPSSVANGAIRMIACTYANHSGCTRLTWPRGKWIPYFLSSIRARIIYSFPYYIV